SGGTPSFCEAACTSSLRASAEALRSGRAPMKMPVEPDAPPWLQVSAVSPMTTSTLATSTSSSSATICAIAMSSDWPMSILPKKAVTRPSGATATQESSSVGESAGLALPGAASTSSKNTGPAAVTNNAPEALRNSRREIGAFMVVPPYDSIEILTSCRRHAAFACVASPQAGPLLGRLMRFPLRHLRLGALDRAQDRHVRSAAALEPCERVAQLGVARLGVLLQVRGCGHDPA